MGSHVITCHRLGQAGAGGDLVPAAEEGGGLHRDQWRVRGQCEDSDGGRVGEVMLSLFQLFHTGFGAHNLFSLSPGK